jgi:diguanylate cyclase (GGDEF)-like protein
VLEIVEGIVERGVAQRTECCPVLGIENSGTLRWVSIGVKLLLFSGLALALLAALAWRVRLAFVENRRANERSSRLLLDAMGEFVEASRASSDAVRVALDRVLREFDSSIDSVFVFEPLGDELVCAYASGSRAEHFRDVRLRRDDLRTIVAKAALDRCRARAPAGAGAIVPTDRAALAVPLHDGDELRAIVYASSSNANALTDVDALVGAAERAAIPYAIALEREADRADATYDGLTGLLTPRAFRKTLHQEVANIGGVHLRVLSLWFVDTDRFKTINDELGHRAGDTVLVAMASLLRAHLVPDMDLGARNGGDEFCALIRATTKTAAIERAAAFCDAVRVHDFGIPLAVTASIGVATYPYDAASSAALLEAADAAMYHSKRNGRDRVSFLVEPGVYAALNASATRIPPAGSRSQGQWPSDAGGSVT